VLTDYFTIAEFEAFALKFCLTVLIGLMFFIVFDLARKSGGGKWAYIALFGGLFLGVAGFLVKFLIKMYLDI